MTPFSGGSLTALKGRKPFWLLPLGTSSLKMEPDTERSGVKTKWREGCLKMPESCVFLGKYSGRHIPNSVLTVCWWMALKAKNAHTNELLSLYHRAKRLPLVIFGLYLSFSKTKMKRLMLSEKVKCHLWLPLWRVPFNSILIPQIQLANGRFANIGFEDALHMIMYLWKGTS